MKENDEYNSLAIRMKHVHPDGFCDALQSAQGTSALEFILYL